MTCNVLLTGVGLTFLVSKNVPEAQSLDQFSVNGKEDESIESSLAHCEAHYSF